MFPKKQIHQIVTTQIPSLPMKHYYHLFNVLPQPCLFLELKEGQLFIKDVNEQFLRNSGMKKEELLERRVRDAFPENPEGQGLDWEQVNKSLKACLESGEAQVLEDLRYDLHDPETGAYQELYFRSENLPVPDENGELGRYALNITQDVTEKVLEERRRLELEKELRQQRELGKYFIEKNEDGLFTLDREGRLLSVNEGGTLLSGFSEADLLGQSFLEFIADYERERLVAEVQAVMNGETRTCEADYLLGESPRRISVTLYPREAEGTVVGCYGIVNDITAQWQAEKKVREQQQALEQSERKHKTLIEKASDLICISNPQAKFTFASESYRNILGYEPKELLGKSALELVYPEDLERVHQEFGLVEKQSQVHISPYRFRNSAGDWRWLETIVTDLRQDPLIKGLLLNTRDVTETIERTRELEELNESYRLAARATNDIIYEWDLQTDEINIKLKEEDHIFGHSKEVVQRRDFWRSHLHPEEKESIIGQLEAAIRDSSISTVASEYRFQRADGSYAHWMDRAYIIRDDQGRPLRLIGAKTDISEQVRQREELALSNKRFSLAMKATNEMIWDWDLESNSISRSSLFLKNYGYNEKELSKVQETWLVKIAEEDRQRVSDSLFGALKDPSVKKWSEEYYFLKKDGKKIFLRDRAFIVRNENGKALRMVGAALDLTETKQLLTQVKEQNRILREVAWEQSHLVRAPLVRIKGLLDFMESDPEEAMTQAEVMKHLQGSTDELDEIIRKIVYKAESAGVI